jgi:hypothetical protein
MHRRATRNGNQEPGLKGGKTVHHATPMFYNEKLSAKNGSSFGGIIMQRLATRHGVSPIVNCKSYIVYLPRVSELLRTSYLEHGLV